MLIDIIDMYKKNKNIYKEMNISITQLLGYYIRKTLVIKLIKHDDSKNQIWI